MADIATRRTLLPKPPESVRLVAEAWEWGSRFETMDSVKPPLTAASSSTPDPTQALRGFAQPANLKPVNPASGGSG